MTPHELNKFMALVNETDTCWLWIGAMQNGGYGNFAVKENGRWTTRRAHRLSYEHFVGSAAGKFVCHKCDVPSCVNPDHLFLGTQKDNLQDAANKGRMYKGGANIPWTRTKTHCKRGHPLAGDNLSAYSKKRVCLACMRLKWILKKSRSATLAQEEGR